MSFTLLPYNEKNYIHKIDTDIHYIYFESNEIKICDIIFSIEMHYHNCLNNYIDLPQDEFITKFKTYEKSIIDIYNTLKNCYIYNEKIKQDAKDAIYSLFHKPLSDVIYETDITSKYNLGCYMVRIIDILNFDSIDLKHVILDIYSHELSLIKRIVKNIYINNTNDIVSIDEQKFLYLTDNDIINDIIKDIDITSLQELFSSKIYEFINKSINYNENKLIDLYNCLDIKYIKISCNDNKLLWIMNKLHIKLDHYIPQDYIPSIIKDLVNNNLDENNYAYIKYNTDATNKVQLNTFMIDKLHYDMHYQEWDL
jgi:hypothetical protein